MPNPKRLTAAQERFCQEYLVDLNAAAAYRKAYPKANARSAEQAGSRLLRNVKVAARVEALMKTRADRVQVTTDDVLRELIAVGTSDIDDVELDRDGRLVVRDGAPVHARKSVSSVKVRRRLIPRGTDLEPIEEITTEIKLWNKVEALRQLGQHLGMFKERVEVTTNSGIFIVPATATPEEWAQLVEAQRAELAKPLAKPGEGRG
jgi:phage terminase small subunit